MKKVSKTLVSRNSKDFSFTNILLIILVSLIFILIVVLIVNMANNFENKESNSKLTQNNEVDVPLVKNIDVDLGKVNLPESVLIEENQITSENYNLLKTKYPFVFNESFIIEYGFENTQINDYILEFKDYVLVYNLEEDNVKSIWLVQSIQ